MSTLVRSICSISLLILHAFSCASEDIPSFSDKITDKFEVSLKTTLLKEADNLRWERKYPSAIAKYKELLQDSVALSPRTYIYSLNQLAYCYLYVKKYQAAKECIDKIPSNTISGLSLADFNLNKGRYLKSQGEGKEAIPYIEMADSLYEIQYKEGHLKRLICLTELADLYYHYEDTNNILEITFHYLSEAGKMQAIADELHAYAKEYLYLKGFFSYIQRTYSEGISNLKVAITCAEEEEERDIMFIARCMSQIGRMHKGMGNQDSATYFSEEAVRLAEANVTSDMKSLQEVYRDHLTLCMKYIPNSFDLYLEKLQNVQKETEAYASDTRLLAISHYRKGNTQKAIQFFREVLERLENGSIKYNKLKLYDESYFALSNLYKKKEINNIDSVFFFLSQSINPTPSSKSFDLTELLRPEVKNQDVRNFVYYAALAEAYATTSKTTALEIYISVDSMLFNYSLMANNEAALNFLAEVAAFDYPMAADIAFQLFEKTRDESYLVKANLFLERLKAFSLFRDMEIFDEMEIPCSETKLVKRQKELKQQLEELKWKKLKASTPKVEEDLQMLLLDLSQLYQQIEQQCPKYHSYKLQQNNITPFEDIKAYVAKQGSTSVLQYSISEGSKLKGVLLQKDTFLVFSVEEPKLDSLIGVYRDYLSKPESTQTDANYLSVAHKLHQLLIAPFYKHIPSKNRVLIVPDEQLNNIPFEALLTKTVEGDNINFKQLPYLVKDWNISYSFSIKTFLLNETRKVSLTVPLDILTFSYSCIDMNQSNNYKKDSTSLNDIMSGPEIIEYLDKKPTTLKQTSFCGADANVTSFNEYANKNFDIMQLSLHAMADNSQYLNNRLVFRKLNNKILVHDEIHGFEIKKIQFQTPLIVLAACETADGQIQKGEGRYSLARTFIEAGANTVLSTLWATKDYSMKKMLPLFYDQLIESPNEIPASLRKAKLDYIENASASKLASPVYWSSFICLN